MPSLSYEKKLNDLIFDFLKMAYKSNNNYTIDFNEAS